MLNKSYLPFYLEGRDAKLFKDSTDDKTLAERVASGDGEIRMVALVAARAASRPHETGRSKTRWVHDHEDEIRTAGGDADEAHRHYIDGRVDALAYSIEADILTELGEMEGIAEFSASNERADTEEDA
jgi:hypothetical protein